MANKLSTFNQLRLLALKCANNTANKILELTNAVQNVAAAIPEPDLAQNDPDSADYVKNRTHWVEGSGETVIFEEATVTCGEAAIMEALPLIEGSEYTVSWDGTKYTCIAFAHEADGLSGIVLGNKLIIGGEDSGEPFVIAAIASYGITMVISVAGAETATVGITENSEVIHKLDNKFIDAEWMASTRTERITFIPETTVVYENETDTATTLEVENIPKEILESGVKTYVTFEGNQYEVNTYSVYDETGGVGMCLIGNWSLAGYDTGTTPPDVPFGIGININYGNAQSPIFVWRSGDGSTTTATIKVEFDGTVYNEMPESFLPDKALKKYYQFPVDLADCYIENSSTPTFTSETYAAMKKAAEALADGLLVIGNYEGIPCIFKSVGYYPGDGMYTMTFAPLSEEIFLSNYSTNTQMYKGKKQLILASSTEGSTKQFKVTVDDSGAPSIADENNVNVWSGKPNITKASGTFDGLGWVSESGKYTQTITVEGVTADNVVVAVPSAAYKKTFADMDCKLIGQAENALTFECTAPQDVAVTVDVIIYDF